MTGVRLWPSLAVVGGLATLGVFVAFNFLPAVTAVYAPGTLGGAISAFQRAETLADLASVFGDPPDGAIVAAQNAVNTLDLYAFIPAYTLFLVAAAITLAGSARAPLAWLAIAPALAGAGADMVETAQQLRLTADWNNADAFLPIATAHWVKYAALGLNALGVSALALLGARKRWVLGLLGLAPLPCVLAVWSGLVAPTQLFSAAFGLYWIALLVVAFMALRRAPDASP